MGRRSASSACLLKIIKPIFTNVMVTEGRKVAVIVLHQHVVQLHHRLEVLDQNPSQLIVKLALNLFMSFQTRKY